MPLETIHVPVVVILFYTENYVQEDMLLKPTDNQPGKS